MLRPFLLLLLGVFACSNAAVLIKASETHPVLLSSVRLLIATALLSPLFLRAHARHPGYVSLSTLRRTTLPAVLLALHFISWSYGARMTLTAQASLIVNLVPVALPFLLHFLVGERITRRELTGTVIALSGVFWLSARDAFSGGGDLAGNLVCFVSMLLFAWYLVLGRQNKDVPSLWLYVIPIYLQAGLLCLVAALPWAGSFSVALQPRELLLLTGLAVIPTIVGHSLLNHSMRHLRGQIVSLANNGQFIFAGVLAFLLFDERPSGTFYLASALVVGGIAIVLGKSQSSASPSCPSPMEGRRPTTP